jgi:predicted MFS family arabinose efflux permease
MVMSLATIAGIIAQTPAGALVDATRAKRLIMIAAAIMVTTASLLLPLLSSFWPVAISQSNTGRFNVAQGAVITAQSIGAALSTALAGLVDGYSAAFLALGAIAAVAVIVCGLLLPDTQRASASEQDRKPQTPPSRSAIAAE